MAKDVSTAFACDVVVTPGKIYGASTAAEVRNVQATASCSVLCDGGMDYRGQLLNEPVVSASLPNQFYGVAEYGSTDIDIANLDETFSHLIEDDERGSFVVVRRYEPGSQTIVPVTSGIIDQTQIGEVVTLRLTPHNLAKLTNNFPLNTVTLREFPLATDVEAPIPVFFGEGRDSSCPYVGNDDVAQNFDYLVGEDALEVTEVKKDGTPAFVLPLGLFTIWATDQIPQANFQARMLTVPNDPFPPGTYTGFFVKGIVGKIRNKIWKVMLHENPPAQYSAAPTGRLVYDQAFAATYGSVGWSGIVPADPELFTKPVVSDSGSFRYDGTHSAFGVNASMTADALMLVIVSAYAAVPALSMSIVGPAGMTFTLIDKRTAPSLPYPNSINLGVWAGTSISSGSGRVTVSMSAFSRGSIQTLKVINNSGPASILTSRIKKEGATFAYSGPNADKMIDFAQDVRTPTLGFTCIAAAAFGPFSIGGSLGPPIPVPTCTATGPHLQGALTLIHGTNSAAAMAVAAKSILGAARGMLYLREPFLQDDVNQLDFRDTNVQIQEHTVLVSENPYPNRTVLRFGRRQQNLDGQFLQISASAIKYRTKRINMVRGSEALHNPASWTAFPGTRVTEVFLDGTIPIPVPTTAAFARIGPGGITGTSTVYISADTGGFWGLDQGLIPVDDDLNTTYTLTLWYLPRTGTGDFEVRLDATGEFDEAHVSLFVTPAAPFHVWQQLKATLVLPLADPLDFVGPLIGRVQSLGVSIISGGSSSGAQFGFVQVETGGVYTYYERTGNDPPAGESGATWTMPDVARAILTNPRWGLGEVVDEPSFESAARSLQPISGATTSLRVWPVEANGVLPGPFNEQPTVKDVLDGICRTRGMVLTKSLNAWHLDIDATGQPAGAMILGTEDTPYDNVTSLSLGQRPTILDSMSTLRTLFAPRLGRFSDNLEPFYEGAIDRTISNIGTVKEAVFSLIKDSEQADRVSTYLAAYAPALDRPLQIEAGQEASTVQPGDVVTLYAPRLQPQNLILSSERDVSPDGWFQHAEGTGVAPSILRNNALGPFGRTYSAAQIQFGAGGTGRSITASGKKGIIVGVPGPIMKACASVWLKSLEPGVPTSCELLLRDAASNGAAASYSSVIELGKTWQQYTFEQPIRATDAASGMYFGIANPTGAAAKNVLMWGAQLSFDWPRGYVKTTGKAIDPTYVYKVTTVGHSREQNTLTAIPYDATVLYAPYTPGVVFMPRIPDELTTSLQAIAPDPVVDLQTPPQTGSGPEGTGNQAGAGAAALTVGDLVWAEISFFMPERNAAGVVVQFQKAKELGWTDVATIFNPLQPGQWMPPGTQSQLLGAPGSHVMVIAHNLVHETTYVVRAISFDTRGRYRGLDDSSKLFVA